MKTCDAPGGNGSVTEVQAPFASVSAAIFGPLLEKLTMATQSPTSAHETGVPTMARADPLEPAGTGKGVEVNDEPVEFSARAPGASHTVMHQLAWGQETAPGGLEPAGTETASGCQVPPDRDSVAGPTWPLES